MISKMRWVLIWKNGPLQLMETIREWQMGMVAGSTVPTETPSTPCPGTRKIAGNGKLWKNGIFNSDKFQRKSRRREMR